MMFSWCGATYPTAGTQTSTHTGLLRKLNCDISKQWREKHQDTVCDNVKKGKTIQSPLHCTEN